MSRKSVHLIIDLAAAGSLAAAVVFALVVLIQLPTVAAVAGGALVFAVAARRLVRVAEDVPTVSRFSLPPLEFAHEEGDALLLDRPIEITPSSPVTRLLKPIPTPGELHRTIERHLEDRPQGRDDTDKLTEALAQLRSAIR